MKWYHVLLGSLVATPFVCYQFFPQKTLDFIFWMEARKAGLTKKKVTAKASQITYSYYDSETKGPTMFWHKMAGPLREQYRVVALDLPGHGETFPRYVGTEHGPDYFVSSVKEFCEAIGIATPENPIHVTGCSMGGMIAGCFAAAYPKLVAKAALLCPAGVEGDKKTEFQRTLGQTPCLLTPTNEIEFDQRTEAVMVKKLHLPAKFKKILVEKAKADAEWYQKIMKDLCAEKNLLPLQKRMKSIECPVLVIWGIEDLILHVSAADTLKKGIRNCEIKLIENCGHSIAFDRPMQSAFHMASFFGK